MGRQKRRPFTKFIAKI